MHSVCYTKNMDIPVDLVVQDSSLRLSDDYRKMINGHPILDSAQEFELATKWFEQGDRDSAQTLVFSNMRGVAYVAKNYIGYGLPFMDLVQEGTIGLMKAVRQFDPKKNVRLFAWALPWIKSEIQQYVVRNWKIVKAATTDARKKLFFNVRKLKNDALPLGDNIRNIANALNIDPDEVREMDQYMNGFDGNTIDALDVPSLSSPEQDLETKQQNALTLQAVQAIDALPQREAMIIQARYIQEPPATLKQLSSELSVSVERVRQLEKQGIQRLHYHISNSADNKGLS